MRTITFLVLALQLHIEIGQAGAAAGDGSSMEKNVPVKWSATEISWKTAIPGEGHSSPVIYGDQVFLLSCLPEKQERVLISPIATPANRYGSARSSRRLWKPYTA